MNSLHTTDIEFKQLPLDQRLLKALDDAKFQFCTPIQAKSLPIILQKKDIAGQAQTGTGKTAAFLLATFHLLLQHTEDSKHQVNQPRALIISPTRELAIQIHKDALLLNKHTDLSLALVYGGVDYEKQRNTLEQGVDILIGTPGRIIDYFKQKVFNFRHLEVVVLDEADRMFDLGFVSDIRYMFRRMPKPGERVSMLFSATLSFRVTELAYEHMNNPVSVKINPEQITTDRVSQSLYHVSNDDKISLLIGLLQHMDPKRTIVFVNTKRTAERVWSYLEGNKFHASILSGDVPQKKRQRLFQEFSEGRLPILVATDLAARGLHIPDVSHVFNYDLPQNAEDYVHRIGRTARAGATGDAISFGCEEYVYSLLEIEDFVGYKIPVKNVDIDFLEKPAPPVKLKKRKFKNNSKRKPAGKNK